MTRPDPVTDNEPGNPSKIVLDRVSKAFRGSSGTVEAMVAGMRANLPSQRQALPQVPEEFWRKFEDRMVKDAPALGDSIAGIYSRTFSLQELRELTAFFNSPIGRRLVEFQPSLIAESSAMGQRWGTRIGEEIAKEMMK